MSNPPDTLDGAEVLCWAVSRHEAFYKLQAAEPGSPTIAVKAMAVVLYADTGAIYLFKCDADWQVVQDWDCDSFEDAVELASQHANGEVLHWQSHR